MTNFESTGSACDHVLKTAIPECNRMDPRPIFVFRLWGMRDRDGMRRISRAYKGPFLFGHKITDTADIYHMPVADSRVWEWKRTVPGVEFMHLAGPCHNCGTNICDLVWGDYDFVQALPASSRSRGADSISFHCSTDILAARFDAFDPQKTPFSIYNIMHLEAAVDFAHGRKRTPAGREAMMAEWLAVSPAAGRAACRAVTASSKMVPLAEHQFMITSALEGWWLPRRASLIQHPYLYMPVSQLSRRRDLPKLTGAWIDKDRDMPVGRPNETRYIIDFEITPKGETVFLMRSGGHTAPVKPATHFVHTRDSWTTTVRIPFKLIGTVPKKNAVWGFNIRSNAAIIVNR
ncbi:MAG: hypothetical protein ABIF71_02100 [Planctomycetota bacterium]